VRKKQVSKDPLAEFERDWKRGIGREGLEDRAWKTGLGDGQDTRSIFLDVLHMRYCVLFQGK
jgi:cobalamin biosynthesis Co2+ chelatase CbiK